MDEKLFAKHTQLQVASRQRLLKQLHVLEEKEIHNSFLSLSAAAKVKEQCRALIAARARLREATRQVELLEDAFWTELSHSVRELECAHQRLVNAKVASKELQVQACRVSLDVLEMKHEAENAVIMCAEITATKEERTQQQKQIQKQQKRDRSEEKKNNETKSTNNNNNSKRVKR
eukprot:PhM_4_TR9121/c0_g1_i1/m.87071